MKSTIYVVLSMLIFISCSGEKETNVSNEAAVKNLDAGAITLTKKQSQTINLETGKLNKRSLASEIRVNGYLDVPPQNKAVVSPMITGYVRKVNFLVGDMVRKGQVMAELESMEFIDLQQQYMELKSELVFSKEDFERQKLLKDQDAVSRKKYLMAEVKYKTAQTTLNGLHSKLAMIGLDFNQLENGDIQSAIRLKAPISGSVKRLEVVIGQHIDPSEEIYEIVNNDHLHLELNVYEKDITKVKKGQKVWFTVPSIKNKTFQGEVYLVGQDLTEEKRSIKVHVHINEEDGPFAVGMYANASISTTENDSYTLPVTALVTENDNEYIFKKVKETDEDITFERRQVITGIESNNLVEIIEFDDVTPEDEVVTNGAFYLLNAYTAGEN
jgi:cobalt-zinc-cadmium efflux system membrane fusion protein